MYCLYSVDQHYWLKRDLPKTAIRICFYKIQEVNIVDLNYTQNALYKIIVKTKNPEIEKFRGLILVFLFTNMHRIYFISVTITVKGFLPTLVVLCVTAGDQMSWPAFKSTVAGSLSFTSTFIFTLVIA